MVFIPKRLSAQDPQFSQFYAASLHLNPAFAGANNRGRAGVNYRNQWPALRHSFTTISAYADYFSKRMAGGFGLIINRHQESFLKLNATEIGGMYAYKLQVGKNLILRTGLQVSYFQKNVNFENVVFSDQIDINSGTIRGPSAQQFNQNLRTGFASISAGSVLYTNNLWIGTAVHHINKPNQSFAGGRSQLDRKFSIHAGYKVPLTPGFRFKTIRYQFQERSVTFAVNYKQQGAFSQLDAGVQFYFQPLIIGGWYRQIPLQSIKKVSRNESIILLLGLELNDDLSFGYSHDFTISSLAGATGGAHEFSLNISFGNALKRTRRDTILPCFKY